MLNIINRGKGPAIEAVFSDNDIQELLKFCPPPATAFRQSRSKNRLIHSDHIRQRLLQLVHEERSCVSIDSIPHLLDLDQDGFRPSDLDLSGVTTTRDGHCIVPEHVGRNLARRVIEETKTDFVNMDQRARQDNLSLVTLRRLVEDNATSTDELDWTITGCVTQRTVLESTRSQLIREMTDVKASKTPRSLVATCVPTVIVHQLASAILDDHNTHGLEGTVELRRDKAVWFVPATQATTDTLSESERDEIVDEICGKGYYELESNHYVAIRESVKARMSEREIVAPVELETEPGVTILMHPQTLDSRILDLVPRIRDKAMAIWAARQLDQDIVVNAELLASILDMQSNDSKLDKLIVSSSPHNGPLLEALSSEVVQIRTKTEADLATLVNDALVGVVLYSNGVAAIKMDDALRLRNQDHVTTYLKAEIESTLVSRARNEKLIPCRAVSIELDRLSTAVTESRNPDQLQTSLRRFQRKTKLPGPNSSRQSMVKDEIMTLKLTAMERMRRASDILQHATWIALACLPSQGDCLFVSSGRDASRMIKVYGGLVCGAVEGESMVQERGWASRLDGSRAKVKTGEDEEGARRELKDLAHEVFEAWKTTH